MNEVLYRVDDLSKLMNISAFRKIMENIRNYKNMKMVTVREKYAKYMMEANFRDCQPFLEELFAGEMGKS